VSPVPSRGAVRDGLLLAVGTLTVARVPPPRQVDAARAGLAMTVAPLVGALLAVPATGVALVALAAGTGPLVAAALAIGVLAWGSGGLHLDGLADTVDGVSAGRGDRERALEVMRRGPVGPLGAATLVLVLVVQVAALARCLSAGDGTGWGVAGAVALPAAAAAGRAVLPLLCVHGAGAARADGLGMAVAGSVPRPVAAAVPLVTAGLAAVAVALAPGLLPGAGPVRVAVAVLAGCLAGALLAARAARRVGGVTGDVLGAGVEWGTTAALVLLATR
jgi:adenosylcobinamide-GDP ribazoletransferase